MSFGAPVTCKELHTPAKSVDALTTKMSRVTISSSSKNADKNVTPESHIRSKPPPTPGAPVKKKIKTDYGIITLESSFK